MGGDVVVILQNWYIKQAVKYQAKVVVEGEREGFGQWHSSVIKRRQSSDHVLTGSGSCYVLEGPMNFEASSALPGRVRKAFQNGFPPDWETILKEELDGYNGSKPAKATRTTVTSKPVEPNLGIALNTSKGVLERSPTKPVALRELASLNDMNKEFTPHRVNEKSRVNRELLKQGEDVVIAGRAHKKVENARRGPTPTKSTTSETEEHRDVKVQIKSEVSTETNNNSAENEAAFASRKRKSKLLGEKRIESLYLSSDENSSSDSSGGHSDWSEEESEDERRGRRRSKKTEKIKEEPEDIDLPLKQVEKRTGLPWSTEEIRRLRQAHATCTARPDRFWEAIARLVGSRTSQECYNQWGITFLPQQLDLEKKKRKEGTEKALKNGKLAGKGTAKYRRQVRDMFEASEENTKDDVFESTPFRKRGNDVSFDFASNIETPLAKERKGFSEDSDSDDSFSVGRRESVDRNKVDFYIAGMTKRRKGVEVEIAPKHARKTHKVSQRSHFHDDAAVVDEGVVRGNFTPNGSVRLKVNKEKLAYQWSSDEDDDDDDEEFNA
mmetsp:Transcript_16411/g.30052  ORF Transcript_16411/g.30052 Transcript_16411/m.30052 type:complete len:552 (-) Transcript_16411:246-1901(-)